MLTPLVLALLCLLPGLPLAVLLARLRPGKTALSLALVEGLLLGLTWYLLVGLVLAHRHQLGKAELLAPTLVLDVVVLGVLFLRRGRWRGVVDNARGTGFSTFLLVLFVVAASLRTKPVYFLYQIGDFGEYVNRANAVAEGGDFTRWFTNGFGALLAVSSTVLGEAHTVDVMGFLGLLVMATVLAIATRLGAPTWARAAVAVALAIGTLPVWYSKFPASETFYAVLLLGMALFLVTAVQVGHHPTAAVAGVLAFALMLTRGNAVLVIPLVLGFALVVAPFVRRPALRIVLTFTAATSAGLFLGFVYNSRFNHDYFIAYQMPEFFPDWAWRRFDDLGGMKAATGKGAIFAVAVAAVCGLALVVNRWSAPRWVRAAVVPVGLVVAVVALFAVLEPKVLQEALERFDLADQVLLGLAAVGAVVAFARSEEDHVRVGVLFSALFVVAYLLVHAYRFEVGVRPYVHAPYFLYWDRYLWSEMFPLAMVLAASGIGAVLAAVGRRRFLRVGLLVLAAAGTVTMWSAGSLSREHRFMGDAYGTLAEVDELTGGLPIVYSGLVPDEAIEAPMGHPNTFRMFAQPLDETFGRHVLNYWGIPPTGSDPVLTTFEEIERIMEETGRDHVAVVQVVGEGRPLLPGVTQKGEVDITVPMLDRPLWNMPTEWRFARYRIVVGEVDRR